MNLNHINLNQGKGRGGQVKLTQQSGKGVLIFFTVVLWMTNEDPATPMMDNFVAFCSFRASRRPRKVKRSSTKTNSGAR